MNPLNQEYLSKKQELMSMLGYTNLHEVPKMEKITVNMGVGSLIQKAKSKAPLENLAKELTSICGQKPIITKARKSNASYHIRRGQEIGLKVTLRRKKMYDFLYKLVAVVLPRIRDFRGIPVRQFDNYGNFSFSIPEQSIFPEIDPTKITHQNGMDVTITFRCKKPTDSLSLLKVLKFPLRDAK